MSRKIFFCFAFITIQATALFSQIKINEFLASNSSVNVDPNYNANADWIELYNAGNAAVNLFGYSISDNFKTPYKWQITQNINIPAKGFLLIWTDDYATGLHANFKLSASSEEIALYAPSLELVDSISFGVQNVDISYGRTPDGSSTWGYFATPTPKAPNNTTVFSGQVDNSPEFLLRGGFYPSAVSVEIFTDLGGTIRYTLDGSEPTEASALYTGAIPVLTTTIIRARIFKPNQIPGAIVTQSYFINENFETRKLPVVSISTNPENFWDSEKGIYVQTFKPEWEIPVNIELFENNGSDRAAFNELAGIKVNGLNSWQLPQKMLGVYFKKQYGSGSLAYQLFFDRNRKSFKDFALRASGNDWSNTMFRDGLVQQACHDYNMKLDNTGFRPSVVYVNGQYLGIHNMREKVDEDYIASNYKLEPGTFDIIENGDFAETGNLNAYNTFWALVKKDLSVQANYDAVAAVMDIENFSDLMVTEMYSGNWSIDHNVMAWKPKDNGKWKWILMDLDRGFNSVGNNLISFYSGQTVWPFSQLMKNANYKKYFGTRLANHLFTTFNPIRMNKRIDYHKNLIEAEMPNHIARWLGATSRYGNAMPSVAYWNNEVAKLKTFANARPLVLVNDLQNYGFSAPAQLSIAVSPSNAGELLFNDMKVLEAKWNGNYPKNLDISLTAVNKPGYTFQGWASSINQSIIEKKSTWNYLDDGTNQNTAWYATGFDASSWKSGVGKFGYGDGNEQTTISYGSDKNNKYITTYFRKTFTVTEEQKSTSGFTINMLCDDGAVIYLNGQEIIRSNMPVGSIAFNTISSTSISGTTETTYYAYSFDPSFLQSGTNVLAVELHQNLASSADLGFDLELIAEVPDTSNFISTASNYHLTLNGDQKLTAVYKATGQCMIPSVITENTTLYKDCSPYIAQGDVSIPENVTLTIEPGVVICLAPGADFIVNGSIQAIGLANERILFKLNPDYTNASWGALCFVNTTDTTRMSYVTIEDASRGPIPIRDVAAISGFKTDLILDNMLVVSIDYDPITTSYSSVVLTNSTLHSGVVGNLLNVKFGKARIENCVFEGNSFPDTDAIDFDNVDNGIIKNAIIRNFDGFNSDGIDLGESKNVQIDSVLIYNIFDKGVSVGLRTTVFVNNVTMMNCMLGFGIKDSSTVTLNAGTFYSVGTPVACYEKIIGRSGGNAFVTNSIMSNSYNKSYSSDIRSFIDISNSISDNDALPEDHSNLFGDPQFDAPGYFNFGLGTGSPAKLSGFYKGSPIDMGSSIRIALTEPPLIISDIFYNLSNSLNRSEFVAIYNPGTVLVDLTGYQLTTAVDFVFPEGATIYPSEKVFVVKSFASTPQWESLPNAWEWTSGSLANEGEKIRLTNEFGVIFDQVDYKPSSPWPNVLAAEEKVLSFVSPELDNHFGENWTLTDYSSVLSSIEAPFVNGGFKVYPNPTHGNVTIQSKGSVSEKIEIFTVTGQKVYSGFVQKNSTIDLSRFGGQLLIAKIGQQVEKIVVLGR